MRIKVIFFCFVVVLAGFIPTLAFAQQDEDVRGQRPRPRVLSQPQP